MGVFSHQKVEERGAYPSIYPKKLIEPFSFERTQGGGLKASQPIFKANEPAYNREAGKCWIYLSTTDKAHKSKVVCANFH